MEQDSDIPRKDGWPMGDIWSRWRMVQNRSASRRLDYFQLTTDQLCLMPSLKQPLSVDHELGRTFRSWAHMSLIMM